MREQIAAANEQVEYWQHWAKQYQMNAVTLRGRLNRWADDIRDLMGAESAFNERISCVRGDPNVPVIRYRVPASVQVAPLEPTIEAIEAERVIEALVYRLNISRDEFHHMVRIELVNERDETIAYAVSERCLWNAKDEEVLTRMIAHDMARSKRKAQG